jgi:hypothetical protein
VKEEALDYTLWRTRFGKGYEPVIRRPTERRSIHIMQHDTTRQNEIPLYGFDMLEFTVAGHRQVTAKTNTVVLIGR